MLAGGTGEVSEPGTAVRPVTWLGGVRSGTVTVIAAAALTLPAASTAVMAYEWSPGANGTSAYWVSGMVATIVPSRRTW